jgi:quercetin dioxygenase-like cupin family protein
MPGDDGGMASVDLVALAGASAGAGVIWSGGETDINANLVRFEAGDGVAAHINGEVELLLVGVAGSGVVEVDGRVYRIAPGQALIIPRGARRAITATPGDFAYLTCHRRRAGLWPTGLPRPGTRATTGERGAGE